MLFIFYDMYVFNLSRQLFVLNASYNHHLLKKQHVFPCVELDLINVYLSENGLNVGLNAVV